MIWTLVTKDFRRLRRHWISPVILLLVPLAVTAIVGITFAPTAHNGQMPRIKLAVVDEDQSLLGSLVAGSVNNEEAAEFLDPVVTNREEATLLLNNNEISAIVILPEGLTEDFLEGRETKPIELIKNPAQQYMPAVVEELLSVAVAGLNAISQNLVSELPNLLDAYKGEGAPDATMLAGVVSRIGHKFEQAEEYLFPPLITYATQTQASSAGESDQTTPNVFAFILPGMAAMFLLYLADATVQDLYVENRIKTLARYRTVRFHLLPMICSKGVYSLLILLLASIILLGGGAAVFAIRWQHLPEVIALTLAYCIFAIGFTSWLSSIVMSEKRAAVTNSITIMLIAFMGGNVMPANSLPPVVRETISVWLPNFWFNQAILRLQFGNSGPHWLTTSLGLLLVGSLGLAISSALFTRQMSAGVKA